MRIIRNNKDKKLKTVVKVGRPAPKYTLVGYTDFDTGQTPRKAIVISTHYSKQTLDKAWDSNKSGLCLGWKEWEPGERAGMDATKIVMEKVK